ncbi:uncharacterized protein LTHEOB_6390 [Lasiodiplodia theobromae]|uniref:uncharacterized protein n=1 Tax=Lasiodiplodia theobromae TaxID=45133 RepID=UPI0015C3780F|nr:uncharacterized protein LTHEOB_6390 [Lasiodiplodia theobromae]KAF4544272.1 hypothetical protein LTHEOB_6390 [Lasiodiplodia theobromae]
MVASASRRYRRARAREAQLATQSAAGQHNATQSRMHALPTEISQHILRYTLTDDQITHDPTNALPLIKQYHVLRRVCWKWNREMPWVLQEWRKQRACVVSRVEHRVGYPRIGLLGPPERERRWIQMRSEVRGKKKKKGGKGGGLNAEAQASPERLMNGAGYQERVEEKLAKFKMRRKRKHRKYMIKRAKWDAAERKEWEEECRKKEEERIKWEEEHKEEIMEQQRQRMEKRYRERAKKNWKRAMTDTVRTAEERGVELANGEEPMSDIDWPDSDSELGQSWIEHDEEYLGPQDGHHDQEMEDTS